VSRSKKFLAVLLYIGLVVALLEAASYFIVVVLRDQALGDLAERHVYSPLRGHELNPRYRPRSDSDADGVQLHSSQGFRRDSLVTKHKPDNVFRIIALGGSTLYGAGNEGTGHYPTAGALRNDETITYFLEKMLNEALELEGSSMTVEVINAGVVAYQTFQHVLYFYETLYQYDPDMLIFLDGHNDYYRVGLDNPIVEYSYSSYRMIPALNERTPFLSIYLFTRYLGQYSYFLKMLEKAMENMYETYEARPYSTEGDYTAIERDFSREFEAWARVGFLRNYKLIEAFSEYYQFSFHVFLQPEVVFEDKALLGEHDRAIQRTTAQLYGSAKIETMERAVEELPRLFARFGIPFSEIRTIAGKGGNGKALYVDYVHLTPRGSQIVADAMYSVLLPKIREEMNDRAVAKAEGRRGIPDSIDRTSQATEEWERH
jgi:hypothetical protein